MNKTKICFYSLSAILFVLSLFFAFCVVGYRFSALLLFMLSGFFLCLGLFHGTKKRGYIILRRIIVAFAICEIHFTGCMTGFVLSHMDSDRDIHCDYVIVLGAGLDGDKPSRTLTDRLERTVEYMKKFPESTAIVSGGMGTGETITEALAMERYLISHGIEKHRIIKEEKAENTNENLRFSKAIIDSAGGGSIAVISSDYHIFRAQKLAEAQGIDAVMLAAETSMPVLRINYAMREGFAFIKAKLLQHV